MKYWIILHINKEKSIRSGGKPVIKGTNATALFRYLRLMKDTFPSPSVPEAFDMLRNDMEKLKVSFEMFSCIVRNFEAEALPVDFDDRVSENDVLEYVCNREFFNETVKYVGALPERERYILSHSLGIECEKKTLDEISKKFGITRERVRQLKNEGIQKMPDHLRFYA